MQRHIFRALLLALLLAAPLFARAETDLCDDLLITDDSGAAISLYDGGKTDVLFLPSCFDEKSLYIMLPDEGEPLKIGKTKLCSGDVTDLFVPGKTVTVSYKGVVSSVRVMKSQNLPALFIQTYPYPTRYIHASKDTRAPGTLLLLDADARPVYDGLLTQVRIRGNSTTKYDKKAYQIKLEQGTPLFGMEKDKTWVLLANYIDRSLLRNVVALNLANAAGLPYTPSCVSADVYVNYEYMGNYLLCEKVSIDKGRVNIRDLEEKTEDLNDRPLDQYPAVRTETGTGPMDRTGAYHLPEPGTIRAYDIPYEPRDITGGYLLEVCQPWLYDQTDSAFVCASGWPIEVKAPEYASVAQVKYISALFGQIDAALDSPMTSQQDDLKALSSLLDTQSFVMKYTLDDILFNLDSGAGSQYMYKNAADPLVYCGPVWDYDNILGVNKTVADPAGVMVNSIGQATGQLFVRLCGREWFTEQSKAAYLEVYRPLLAVLLGKSAETETLCAVTTYAQRVRASAEMNFVRWPIDYSYHKKVVNTGMTYQANIDYLIRFLTQRVAYLDKLYGYKAR